MGERSLRGSRLGSVSYETERNTAPIERQYAEYRCPQGHLVTVPFADDVQRVQVQVLCWCGLPGLLNARVVGGTMVREGATVVVADTAPAAVPSAGTPGDDVRYQVLCRRHYVRGALEPTPTGPGQLALR